MAHHSPGALTGSGRRLFFREKEWSGFIWLLKIIAVYFALGFVLTMIIKHTPAGDYLGFMTWFGGFPVYLPVAGFILGLPAYHLCRAAVQKYKTKSRGLDVVLLFIALFGACVVIPQMFLPRVLPVFTSVLVFLFVSFFFLWGLGYTIVRAIRDIRKALRGS